MYWVLFFFIWGIRDLMDAKPLFKNNDIGCLSGDIRKKYRHRRGSAFLLCETIYGIRLGFRSAFIYFGIPYAILILYIIYLKKKYHVPGFWTKKQDKDDCA